MAEDFEIRVGIEPEGGTRGTAGNEGMAFGVSKGLKIAGVVGILSQIKIVTDTIGIVLELISVGIVQLVGFLGGLLGLFITKVAPFFEDPTRSLIRFGLFVVNGIISGLEFVLNGILGIFGGGGIELPRFQEQLVLEAFDEYRETTAELSEQGKVASKEGLQASINFMNDLKNSFITNSEFQELLQERLIESQNNTNNSLNSVNSLADALGIGSNSASSNVSTAFSAVDNFARILKQRANSAAESLGGRGTGGRFVQSAANIELGIRRRQSTRFTEREAKSGLYLLNKLGG